MTEQIYEKILTANDTGETGGHQAGIHIPKSQDDLLLFLPALDRSIKNPDSWIIAIDDQGIKWRFRYIYYNNRLHDEGGTRDEYRITHMTKFFRAVGAHEGDTLVLSGRPGEKKYKIYVRKEVSLSSNETDAVIRIRLKGWKRIH